MATDVSTLQIELDALRALKLKLIRAGGVLETRLGNRSVRRWTLKEITDAMREIEREIAARSGNNFYLAAPIE